MIFKLSYLNSNLALTLGYFNPALNNLALQNKKKQKKTLHSTMVVSPYFDWKVNWKTKWSF